MTERIDALLRAWEHNAQAMDRDAGEHSAIAAALYREAAASLRAAAACEERLRNIRQETARRRAEEEQNRRGIRWLRSRRLFR